MQALGENQEEKIPDMDDIMLLESSGGGESVEATSGDDEAGGAAGGSNEATGKHTEKGEVGDEGGDAEEAAPTSSSSSSVLQESRGRVEPAKWVVEADGQVGVAGEDAVGEVVVEEADLRLSVNSLNEEEWVVEESFPENEEPMAPGGSVLEESDCPPQQHGAAFHPLL